MNITMKKLSEITPYDNNPRQNEKAIEVVANSIKEFGFKTPIVVDKFNIIINGHTRYKAALKLGLTEAPVVVADKLSPEQVKAYRIMDNRTSELAEWDVELLLGELKDLEEEFNVQNFDAVVGFTAKDMEQLAREYNIPLVDNKYEHNNDNYNVNKELCAMGDIWELGKHKIIIASSKDKETFNKLLGKTKCRLLVTELIEKGEEEETKYQHFYKVYKNVYDNLVDGGSIYINNSEVDDVDILQALKNIGFKISSTNCWIRTIPRTKDQYQQIHELYYYGWKETGAHLWNSDRKQTTIWRFDDILGGNSKPNEMIEYMLKNNSVYGESVIDNNVKDGAVIIACEMTGRTGYGIANTPENCETAIERYIAQVGSDKVRVLRAGRYMSYEEARGR